MSDGYKTMRVPQDKWEQAKAQKEENGRTWGQQIVRPDSDGVSDGVVIENVEINTNQQGLDEADVRRIVERWIENNYEDLRRGRI